MPPFTSHAQRRTQQRAVSRPAVEACLSWGNPLRQPGGRTAFHLGEREVRLARRQGVDVAPYCNTAVVVATDGTVITVIRTPDRSRLRRFWR